MSFLSHLVEHCTSYIIRYNNIAENAPNMSKAPPIMRVNGYPGLKKNCIKGRKQSDCDNNKECNNLIDFRFVLADI